MRVSRLVAAVALLAVLLPAVSLSESGPAAVAAPLSGNGPSCVVGTELVANGSFESPIVDFEIGPGTRTTPDGWSGVVGVTNGYYEPDTDTSYFPFDGEQYALLYVGDTLSQTLATSGLAGATLTLTFQNQFFPATVALGGATLTTTIADTSPWTPFSLTHRVPTRGAATTQLSFSGAPDLDVVSVVVSARGSVNPGDATRTPRSPRPNASAPTGPVATETPRPERNARPERSVLPEPSIGPAQSVGPAASSPVEPVPTEATRPERSPRPAR